MSRVSQKSDAVAPEAIRLPPAVLYYGVDKPEPERRILSAGPLRMVYEAGELRYIRLGDREIVRRIYVTLRDENWGTLVPRIGNVFCKSVNGSFELSFDAEYHRGNVDFGWRGRIDGDANGTVTFRMEGRARSRFLTNRLGLCVLHPIHELAGTRCMVQRPNGATSEHGFPFEISPHQPFTDIRAIRHRVGSEVWASLDFLGEVFEIEDQRNWTDGSYKTYCPPLVVPYPREVTPDMQVDQTVRLSLGGYVGPYVVQGVESEVSLILSPETGGAIPSIGLGYATEYAPLGARQLDHLKQLNLSHLRVDLRLSQPDYRLHLKNAWSDAEALGAGLEVALVLSGDPEKEIEDLLDVLRTVSPKVSSWLIFDLATHCSSADSLGIARKLLSRYDKNAVIGGGTNANYAEVNRSRPHPQDLDLLCYSVNPQVHGSDNSTLVEALAAQASTVISTKRWAEGRPISVTPITLKARFNPYRRDTESSANHDLIPSTVDQRQASLFAACWTLGSLKYLAESGASSLTYFETQGWRGVQGSVTGPNLNEFHSYPGIVFPIFHVLADVQGFQGATVVRTRSSEPLRVNALCLVRNGTFRLMCANFTGAKESVTVQGIKGRVRLRPLNETNASLAMFSPEEYRAKTNDEVVSAADDLKFDLPPYGLMRIDGEVATWK
jgi:D-apionolactonase